MRVAQVNTNTYVSVAVLISILTGFFVVVSAIYNARSSIAENQIRFENKLDGLTDRVKKTEESRETWSLQDMFKWAVRLQRLNNGSDGSVKLNVPEPDNHQ